MWLRLLKTGILLYLQKLIQNIFIFDYLFKNLKIFSWHVTARPSKYAYVFRLEQRFVQLYTHCAR